MLTHERELVEGQEYRIAQGPGQDEVGVCLSITRSDFGMVWGEIKTPVTIRRVRWNVLAPYPEPKPRQIAIKIGLWLCPTCGEQAQFAGFCENDHEDARLVYHSCVTVEQIGRARIEWVEKFPESRHTVDGFIEKVIGTPLFSYQ